MTAITDREALFKEQAKDMADRYIQSTQLRQLFSPESAASAEDLLVNLLMQAWHEGAIHAIDEVSARLR